MWPAEGGGGREARDTIETIEMQREVALREEDIFT